MLTFVVCILVLLVVVFIFQFSKLGLWFTAVSSDTELATSLGINARLVKASTFGVAGVIVSATGILHAYDTGIRLTEGLDIVILSAMISMIGGRIGIIGITGASAGLAALQHLAIAFSLIGSRWSSTLAYAALMIIFIVKSKPWIGGPAGEIRGVSV